MQYLRNILASNFESFSFFYGNLRYRILILVSLSLIVGVLDGFGLAMFLPMLQLASDASQVDAESLGNMRFLIVILEEIGLGLNLLSVLLLIVVFFLLKGFVKLINGIYRSTIRQFFVRKLREKLLSSFKLLRFKHFVTSDIGRIQNTMTGEVERVIRSFSDYFKTVEQVILVSVYMGFAFYVDARFAILVLLGGGLTNILYRSLYRRTKGLSKNFTKESHRFQGKIIQFVSNFKYLKATGLLDYYSKRINTSIREIEQKRRRMGELNAILESAREPMLIVVVAAVITIQTQVLNAPLAPILISLVFFYRALTALVAMQYSWSRFLEVSGSLDNMLEFQAELVRNQDSTGEVKIANLSENIVLREVGFEYDGKVILDNISVEIKKNETVAIVGESGSGKTTIANIIAALITPSKGEMLVDNKSVLDINQVTYQERIGYITQEPVIFNDSIFNNITFWAEPTDSNLRRFAAALEKASIHNFVMSLPEKQETLLGYNGINLSGGQRQRISIARELYKDIDILIMDEATSSLDSETEKSIQHSIDNLHGEFTIIVIAHRLSTIRNVDKIILLDKGRVICAGPYDYLLSESDSFRRMVKMQEV